MIQEGGMPTAKQSAPARCEFRGGIEAYCLAAARALRRSGNATFVVCENYMNHDRVNTASTAAGLRIVKVLMVEGTAGRGILFAVYVMKHLVDALQEFKEDDLPITSRLTVREDSAWSRAYLQTVMKDMSIPSR